MRFESFVSFQQGGLWLWLTAEWQRHDNESCLHLKRDSNWHRRTKSKKFKWVNMAKQIERFWVLDMSWPLFCVQIHFSKWLGHFRLCFGFLTETVSFLAQNARVSDFEFSSNVLTLNDYGLPPMSMGFHLSLAWVYFGGQLAPKP